MVKLDKMVKLSKIKEGKVYTPGYYYNRVPVSGLYINSKKGSLLEGLEIYAKSKFKLERDPENYAQEARLETWLALEKYYKEIGSKEDSKDKVNAWVYTVVKNRLDNLSKAAKSNVSYYDYEKEEYIINNILYLDKRNEDDCEEYLDVLMEIEEIKKSSLEGAKSEFKVWLDRNKENLLTKKQIGYLEGEVIINDKGNISRIKKNIIKRIDKKFHDDYILENRIHKEEFKLKELTKITECYSSEEIRKVLVEMNSLDQDYVIDILYNEMDIKDCKILTKILNGYEIENNRFFNKILSILLQKEQKVKENLKNYNLKLYI